MSGTPSEIAHRFVAAINAADLASLRALMAEDHTFTDALGRTFSGADGMIRGWQQFLHLYPEYRIEIDRTLADGTTVALFGRAGGKWRTGNRISPGRWCVAAAMLAEVDASRIRRWSVFCDTRWAEPPQEQPAPEPVADPEGDL